MADDDKQAETKPELEPEPSQAELAERAARGSKLKRAETKARTELRSPVASSLYDRPIR